MRKAIRKTTGILIVLLLIIPASCKKYDEGPWFSLQTKTERVTGTFYFSRVEEDGVDRTEEYANQSVNMQRNGNLYWAQGYYQNSWETYGIGGEWNFASDRMQIEMHFLYNVIEEYTLVWNIIRLADKDPQLILERYEGDKKIRWEMWKRTF